MTSIPMTQEGKKRLEEELKQLKTKERPKVIQAISEARSHGDLSENAEYDAAKNQQSFIEGRIKELEDKLARANVVDTKSIKSERVLFGATVEIKMIDTEEVRIYRIVGVDESDVKTGKLSIESPIARQLLNKRAGDVVTVKVPRGETDYEVLAVKYE